MTTSLVFSGIVHLSANVNLRSDRLKSEQFQWSSKERKTSFFARKTLQRHQNPRNSKLRISPVPHQLERCGLCYQHSQGGLYKPRKVSSLALSIDVKVVCSCWMHPILFLKKTLKNGLSQCVCNSFVNIKHNFGLFCFLHHH